jgi:hypothetical protein
MARTSPPSPTALIQAKLMVAKDQAHKKKEKRLKAAKAATGKTKSKGASKTPSVTQSTKENQAPVPAKGITIS